MPRALVIMAIMVLFVGCSSGGLSVGSSSGSSSAPSAASPTSITRGPAQIASSPPPAAKGPSDSNGNAATPKVTAAFAQPVETNKWWSSLIWQFYPANPYSENLYPHPLAFHAFADGMGVSYPSNATVGNSGKFYEYPYSEDFRVGVPALNAADARVAGYSDWTVTASIDDGARGLLATIGHGLPYAYFQVHGGDGLLNCAAPPVVWSNNAEVVGFSVNGHHYGLFAPSGSIWSLSGSALRSSLNGNGWFSVALLPDNSPATLEFFRQRAYAWVDGTSVAWAYDESSGQLAATYSAHTVIKEPGHLDHTVLALYRHQWLHTDAALTSYAYVSARGQMKVLDGSSFTTRVPFTGVLPNLPDMGTTDRAKLYAYVDAVYQEQLTAPLPNSDTYFVGKALGRLAHLVPIAEQVGHTQARDLFLQRMQATLDDFFDGTAPDLFAYNRQWNTLIGYPASFGSDTQLNDHHFHYGYFLMAAATLARYNPTWAAANAAMVQQIASDPANADRTSTAYPFLRNYDVYAGHAWASGPAPFAAGNNQESSSESIDFSTGLILWGTITGDKALRDEGIYLHCTEAEAIHQYWFDEDQQVFPAGYLPPTAGIVWSDGASYSTWWTADPDEIHGINFLPVQPGELHLGYRPDYVKRNYDFLVQQNGGPEQVWRDIIWSFEVFADPLSVMTKFLAGTYTAEGGESLAHTYHWLWNIAALGTPNATVSASTPTFAVFDKAGVRTYVTWNPTAASQTVHFSDGTTMAVGPGQMGVQQGASTPTPTPTPTTTPPTPTPTPTPLQSSTLYVRHGGSLSFQAGSAAQSDIVPSANGHNYDGTPNQPLVYVFNNLTGSWRAGESTRFHLYVDAGNNVADGVQARVSYDFNGSGTYGRVETYHYYPTNDLPGFEDYTELQGVSSATGTYGDMRGGTVKLEVWNAIGTTPTMLRTDATAADQQQSTLITPFDVGVVGPTPTPTPSPNPPPTSGTLYFQSGGILSAATGSGAQTDVVSSAAGVNYDGTPHNPLVYTIRGVNGTWRPDLATSFRLYVDAGAHVGDAIQVRISYDFNGTGTFDRVETYNYFATDDLVGWEAYDQTLGLRSVSGTFRNFTNATVKVEVWCPIGQDPVMLRTSATAAEGKQSILRLPL